MRAHLTPAGCQRTAGKRSSKLCRAAALADYMAIPYLFLLLFIFSTNFVSAIELSNDPMETKVKSAPSNIMFILDNSGSMDWEFATSGTEGRFSVDGTLHSYLYSNTDNSYSTTDSNGKVLTGDNRGYWKSQWHGFNRIYYNPSQIYLPWPGKNNITLAELKTVRSNPQNAAPTVDLTENYLVKNNMIMVDNAETSPKFTYSGSWSESGHSGEYLNSSFVTSTNGSWARWTPNIPEAGEYSVYAWWVDSQGNRDRNACYKIQHASGNTGCLRKDQTQNVSQFNLIGTFTFNAGATNYVEVVRNNPDGSYTSADAVGFSKSTATQIVLSIIHYYTWNDANSNNTVDNGEVYLVNFNWSDSNTNSTVEAGELIRSYYQVLDNNSNDKVEHGELVGPLTGTAILDGIKAKKTLEEGGTQELTADEEALNFANWFGYYRKRAMAAKYAVSAAINDFTYVNVGFYTINDNGDSARIAVKPVHAEIKSLVVDNKDTGFSQPFGTWSESEVNQDQEYLGSSNRSRTSGAKARWTPNIPETGQYKVYARWVASTDRVTNACYTVHVPTGDTTKCVNQTQNGGAFGSDTSPNYLGTYTFSKGTSGYVELLRDNTSNSPSYKYISADAIMFEPVGGGVTVDETESLRSTLYGVNSESGTPLRTALYAVGRYFDVEDTGGFAPNPSTPYCSEADGGACQQAFAILMTDGYYNDSFSSVGNVDNGMIAPYGDTYSNTLADVARKFYDDDLADNLSNELPTNNYDTKQTQHMVTYTVSFGVEGTIPLADINKDGTPDTCRYADDPYFLNPCTPKPTWPDPDDGSAQKIDDLWHASINGHGQFFSASSPDELAQSLKEITKNIKSRMASGASVAVNGEELNDGTVLYQATYDPGKWIGNVIAYPVNKSTGEILRAENQELWQASEKLQSKTWSNRLIFTSDGEKTGLTFDYTSLTPVQKAILGSTDVVDYLRGEEKSGMRTRDKKLGDIVHSSPLLTGTITARSTDGIDNDNDGKIDEPGESVGGTIFAGGNDGMLHAFNAQTGEERFAFVPSLIHDHLTELTRNDYSHRFYVDATPVAKTLTFSAGDRSSDGIDNDRDGTTDEPDENYSDSSDNNNDGQTDEITEKKTLTMLVGGLGRGGKGYYGLDITQADQVTSATSLLSLTTMVKWEYPRRYFDGIDNDGDGKIDEADEAITKTYEYSYAGDQRSVGGSNHSDGRDNNGDGNIDEKEEKAVFITADSIDNDSDGLIDESDEKTLAYRDDDLGYSFSTPAIVRSYRTMNPVSPTDHPWVVIFGNGYESYNGHAVLYILDVLTGELIRKIDTGIGGNNGLSSPVAVDVNDDDRIDFVYAGDLKGNLWKFDMTSNNPAEWRVAHENATGVVQPMFSAPGQPITSRPDVMYHCTQHGYLVTFGTGKFLGEPDRTDASQQTIFGIWDYGDPADRREYPGEWNRTTRTLSNISGVQLQQQSLIDERYSTYNNSYLRTVSAHAPHWYLEDDTTAGQKGNPASKPSYLTDTIDNDKDGRINETTECDLWSASTATCLGHTDSNTNESTGHVGWYFDLPGRGSMDGIDNNSTGGIDEAGEKSSTASERVVKDVTIRDGKLIVLSFIPDASPCSGGGTTVMHEITACSGSRLSRPAFDINGDKKIDDNDYIIIGGQKMSVSGIGYQGMLHPGVFLGMPDKKRELKIFSSSAGTTEVVVEEAEEVGLYYWREVNN